MEFSSFDGWPFEDLAELFNRSFEDYFVEFQFDASSIEERMHVDAIDHARSRIVSLDGNAVGIAWVALRGKQSRIAAMGIVQEARRRGVGRALLGQLLADSREAGEESIVLEVITENSAAIALYESVGFVTQFDLLGFRAEDPAGEEAELEEIGRSMVAESVKATDGGTLPWQISGENLGRMRDGSRTFRRGNSSVIIADPKAPEIRIYTVITDENGRWAGSASRLLRAVFARFPHRTWVAPPICPPGPVRKLFPSLGFEPLQLEQMLMRLTHKA